MTHNGKIRKKGKWRRVVVPCPLTWHSVLVAAPDATPILCRRNATVPGMARQWVRPRSSAMSIDVALSTRRGVGRDTYSLPQKNAATPQVARQWVRPRSSAMSIDVALSTRRGVGRNTYSLPQKRGGAPGPCQWTWPY